MEQHIFVGSGILCQVCKKSRANSAHGDSIHVITCVHCSDPSVYTCASCQKPVCERHKSLHLNGHNDLQSKIIVRPELPKPIIENCPGHICIDCGVKWEHYYPCGKKADYQNKCRTCASQATAEITRPKHIDEIKLLGEKTGLITAQEQKEIALTHYGSVKLMIQKDGQLLDNWQEIISQHILGLEKIMLKIRIHSESARKLRVDTECEEMTKLTPEEREQFAKDAARLKERKTPKVSETEKKEKKIDKGYQDTLKAIAATLKAKGLTGDTLKAKLASKAELADIPKDIVKEFEI